METRKVQKFDGLKILAYISINLIKFLSSSLIEAYIVEKLMKRPTTCANFVLRFRIFLGFFKFLTFRSSFRAIGSLGFLGTTLFQQFSLTVIFCWQLFAKRSFTSLFKLISIIAVYSNLLHSIQQSFFTAYIPVDSKGKTAVRRTAEEQPQNHFVVLYFNLHCR